MYINPTPQPPPSPPAPHQFVSSHLSISKSLMEYVAPFLSCPPPLLGVLLLIISAQA